MGFFCNGNFCVGSLKECKTSFGRVAFCSFSRACAFGFGSDFLGGLCVVW